MALFGLGNFSQGFITGLADSANEALKKDLDRVNTRIEKLSDLQVNRALKEQDERKEEIDEVIDELERGSSIFGDDPKAKQYAAAMLKKEGNLQGYRELVSKYKEMKSNNPTFNPASYIQAADTAFPTGSFRDYAEGFVPRKTYTGSLPEGVDVTGGAGNLLKNIGLDQKIARRVSSNVKGELAASGMSLDEQTSLALPDMKFDDEGVFMANMTPSESLKYIREQKAKSGVSDDRLVKLNILEDEAIEASIAGGNDADRLQGQEMKLAKIDATDPENEETITKIKSEIQVTTRAINIKNATTKKEKLELQSAYAYEDGNPALGRKLKRQAEDLEGTPLLPVQIKRLEDDIQRGIDVEKNKEILQVLKLQQAQGQDITQEELGAMSTRITSETKAQLQAMGALGKYTYDADGKVSYLAGTADENERLQEKFDEARQAAIEKIRTIVTDPKDLMVLEKYISDADMNLSSGGSGKGKGDSDTTTLPETNRPIVYGDGITDEQKKKTNNNVIQMLNMYPDTDAGADTLISETLGMVEIEKTDEEINKTINTINKFGYSSNFIKRVTEGLKTKADTDPEITDPFGVYLGDITVGDFSISEKELNKFIREETFGYPDGRSSMTIKDIAEKYNIPISDATTLYNTIKIRRQEELDKQNESNKKPPVTSGGQMSRVRKQSGGLMTKPKDSGI